MNHKLPDFIYNIGEPLDIVLDNESKEYKACDFLLNGKKIKFRQAKTTPTKAGQFVTLWKRTKDGPIAPYDINDEFDFVIISSINGYFSFPKSALINQNIVSAENSSGKRAFRIYLPHETNLNKQATKSQNWQKKYYNSNSS